MSSGSGISHRVLDGLVDAGLMTAEQASSVIEAARDAGTHEGTVLTDRAYVSPFDVMSVLEHEMGVPQVDLASYTPEDEAIALIPASVARSYRALPLFEIEGMLTVAVGDPMDVFGLDAIAGLIGLEVEAVLADPVSVDNALDQYYPAGAETLAAGSATDTSLDKILVDKEVVEASDFFEEPLDQTPAVPVMPIEDSDSTVAPVAPVAISEAMEQMAAEPSSQAGPAAIDLDVLAVADTRRVAVLVSDILEDAVARGASRIHLLPYKDDFFLVYRIKGGLEKVASAPLAMQAGLIEGFKQFAHLDGVPATRPALGRVHTHISDKDLVLTISVVPTISGQRLVVSLSAFKPQPRSLEDLGVSDAEARALRAMVERGRGILLVCAPVAGGASATYYALLAHAASAGKTVYSVEQSIEHEIPAVAQVMIEPGGLSSAAYIAAGMRQDTDVIAVDGLRSVEDVHLAVEAAGMGKLVVATFPAADIASGVWRMLELGAEPHSLAAALTLAVGQRLVRLNCPNCSIETDGQLASRIPGSSPGLRDKAGSGCPNCGKSGFRGAVAIHEVLPFTEPVRAAVGRAAGVADIMAASAAAGMRPLAAAGLLRVKNGEVSAEELNRVLRFAG
ncbi:MAG: ATPase, T2SS/T4P/T4SS family [Coriobacteriia bacterium]|nr:ATPase, T2SS/T4P/T4SS family [Coriobacteriia bacterium]